MNRRKYLAALGVLGSGTAAAMGTGAFTSVSASRDVSVSVADDTNGYLGLSASPNENGEFASVDTSSGGDGEIALDFGASDGGGSGVGLNSTYNFDDVFRIENQGTQTIYVWANFSGEDLDDDDIWFYPGSDSDRELNDGSNSVVTLTTGQQVNVGVHIDTSVLSSTDNQALTASLTADVDVPGGLEGSQPSDPVGEDAAVVSKDPDAGEFSSIQDAIDAVDGTTVLVESGRYEESVAIDVDGLTLKGPNAGIAGDSDQRGAEANINGLVAVDAEQVIVDGFAIEREASGSLNQKGVIQMGAVGDSASGSTIANNTVTPNDTNSESAGLAGVAIESADNVTISDNVIAPASGSADTIGITRYVSNIENLTVSDNVIETTLGVAFGGTDATDKPLTYSASITGNQFDNSGTYSLAVYESENLDVTVTENEFSADSGIFVTSLAREEAPRPTPTGDGEKLAVDQVVGDNTFNTTGEVTTTSVGVDSTYIVDDAILGEE